MWYGETVTREYQAEMSDKVHTIILIRNGSFNTSFTAKSLEELEDYLPSSMKGNLQNAVCYGQEKFYQGETRYNLLYSYWNLME